jgi:hypothetical protein
MFRFVPEILFRLMNNVIYIAVSSTARVENIEKLYNLLGIRQKLRNAIAGASLTP